MRQVHCLSTLGCRRDSAVRGVFVDSLGKSFRQPRKDLFSREPCVLRQSGQYVWPDSLFEVRRTDLLVGPAANPGISRVAVTGLFEAVDQVAQAITQHISNACPSQQSTELAGKAAACASTGPLSGRVHFTLRCLEPFRDLVPVLVTRHGEERQQGCHRWIATTHNVLLFDACFRLRLRSTQAPQIDQTLAVRLAKMPHLRSTMTAPTTGSYDPGTFASLILADCLPQESCDECPGNTQKCRQDKARGLVGNSWMNPPRDEPRQEADDDCPDDTHSALQSLMVRRRDDGATDPGDEIEAHVAALADGGFVVTWTDEAGLDIRAAVYDAGGGLVQGNILVNVFNQQGQQFSSDVAALPDGGFIVAWEDNFDLVERAQRFDEAGNLVGTDFTWASVEGLSLNTEIHTNAATYSDGRVLLTMNPLSLSTAEDVQTSIWDTRITDANQISGDNFFGPGGGPGDILLMRDVNGVRQLEALQIDNSNV